MRPEQYDAAIDPKVRGTINLHDATLGCEIDFFVMLSSISGIMGNRGQCSQYPQFPSILHPVLAFVHRLCCRKHIFGCLCQL